MELGDIVKRIAEARNRSPVPVVAIYALMEDGLVVYVGSTLSPMERLAAHRASERFRGRVITMEVLTYCEEDQRNLVEKFAISIGLREGYPLENVVWNTNRNRGMEWT